MLLPGDIRIGNQVMHTSSNATVTVLEVEESKVLVETFPANSYVLKNEIEGIPLTFSLLNKLSFTNEEEQDTWSGEGVHIHLKQDGFFYGLRIAKSKAKMQYLHQLQNYVADYYALFKQKDYALDLSSLLKNA